jgi:lysophospholipase L1-like esterase
MKSVLQRFLLVLFGLLIAVILAEGALQLGALFLRASGRTAIDQVAQRVNLRVLSLGDSNTYGLHVEREQAYPMVMERMWLRARGEGTLEVINAGIPGTNSSKLRSNLQRLLQTFRPDVVTVMIGANDLWTEPVQPDSSGAAELPVWKRLRLYTLLRVLTAGTDEPEANLDFRKVEGLRGSRGAISFGDEQFFLGWTRRVTNGVKGWRSILTENLREIDRQTRAAGVHLVLITYASEKTFYWRANQVLRLAAEEQNLPLVDVRSKFQRACRRGSCEDLYFKSQHPTEKGHRLIATALKDYLELLYPVRR